MSDGSSSRWPRGVQRALQILLAVVSLTLCLGVAEIVLRTLLFGNASIGARLRHAGLYADPFSDDNYWILQYVFKQKGEPPKNPHPLLGWAYGFDRQSYRHDNTSETAGRRPVLMYGDSFTRCAQGVECFQDILNSDTEFATDHFLMNYGVGGYGLGQIYLLLKNSLDQHTDPFVVIGFMTFDLDRSFLSVRTGQKPRFEVERDRLHLTNTPIEANPADWFAAHPPTVGSYVAAMVTRQAGKLFPVIKRKADIETQKMEVNRLILDAIEAEVQSRGLDRVYVVFHANWEGVSTLDASTDWRDPFLIEYFKSRGIPYIWSRELVQQDRDPNCDTWDGYIGTDHGHPTRLYNELVSQEIKATVFGGSSAGSALQHEELRDSGL